MGYYQPHLIVKYMVYFLMVWFFIASISTEDRKVNLSLFAMYLVNTIWFEPITFTYGTIEFKNQYILNKEFLVGIDVFFGLIIFALSGEGSTKYSWRQFALLGFVVLCHSVILYRLTVNQTWLVNLFYNVYDELVIIVGILQVCISRDGLLNSIRRIQVFTYGIWVRDIRDCKIHLTRRKRKG